MPTQLTAKLFKNGRSQAVRLPLSCRFEGTEVLIRKDEATGDVILSPRRKSWADFFALVAATEVPDHFMSNRLAERPIERHLFRDAPERENARKSVRNAKRKQVK